MPRSCRHAADADRCTVTVMGLRLALVGVALPAALHPGAHAHPAVRPQFQGILLTGIALVVFTLAMLLAPRLKPLARTAPEPTGPMEPAIG